MEFRQLRYFVAVADELHFTRAADKLGIAQPPLSQQIRKLEREIGTPLFYRLTRGVELTEAGRQLREDAQHVLDAAQQAVSRAQSAARGLTGHMRVGFASSTVFHPLVARTLRQYHERYPNIAVAPTESHSPALLDALRERRLDAAMIRLPLDTADAAIEMLIREALLVVLPARHRLAGEPRIALTELRHETLILFPRWIGPGLYDATVGACLAAGFSPKLGQESPQVSSTVSMTAAGFGVSIIPESIRHVHADGVTYHGILGRAPRPAIALAYRRGERAPAVRNLIALVKELARSTD